jgi:hypothetical protein
MDSLHEDLHAFLRIEMTVGNLQATLVNMVTLVNMITLVTIVSCAPMWENPP